MKNFARNCLLLLVLACPGLCVANIYKCVDDNGQTTFADTKTRTLYKNCQLFMKDDNQPLPSAPANKPGKARTQTPADFPRIDRNTQNARDDKRRQILQSELESEKQALAEAKAAYTEGSEKPEVYRGADGKTYRNVVKFEAKMLRLQADVEAHTKNVQLLQKELERLR